MDRSERVTASVTEEQKFEFRIAAERRDMSQSELLRELVENFLAEEEIPDEVKAFFREEVFGDEGNAQPATAAN